jgi:glycosyltransferase involved in cell wall biosynthesis
MRILFITHNLLPQSTSFGSAVHTWSILMTLLERGYEVHLLSYEYNGVRKEPEQVGPGEDRIAEELIAKGVRLHLFPRKPVKPSLVRRSVFEKALHLYQRLANPTAIDYYAGPLFHEEISNVAAEIKPDAVIAYTFDAVSASSVIHGIPRMASVVDLDHLARKYRGRFREVTSLKDRVLRINELLLLRKLPGIEVELLKTCDFVYDHAFHHCNWLKSQGVKQARYLPVVVLDYAGKRLKDRTLPAPKSNGIHKISLIGKVNGIATLEGLYIFATNIMPELESLQTDHPFEIHIIGGGEIPANLRGALNKSYIKIRGFVDDIASEYLSSDILLVPTPVDLGFRTRIAEGFSFGSCVVAHSANSAGMPELVNEKNILMAESGSGLARAIARCLESSALREQLGAAARNTYERQFCGQMVANQMIDDLEKKLGTRSN